MFRNLISSVYILFLLLLLGFSIQACNYKDSGFFSPMGDIEDPNIFIPSLPELEGEYGVTYRYTQNTCNDNSGEYNVTAGIQMNPTNTNWMNVFFPDVPGAITGPYDEETGNFMGETDRKPIGQGYTAMETWNMDIYPRMSNDENILFGGISRVDVYNPDDTFNCGIDYEIFGEKISNELPPTLFALTVEKDGEGSVSSTPTGINCGDDCSEKYEEGTEVTLRAEAAEGWIFDGWSGDVPDTCSDDSNSCTIEMNGVKTVKATFIEDNPFSLFFPNPLVCIEHGTSESKILWLFIFDQIIGEGNISIVMEISFQKSVEVITIETLEEFLEILVELDIDEFGTYDWEIIEAYYTDSGEEIPIDGTTSGQVEVGPNEKNEGQCTE